MLAVTTDVHCRGQPAPEPSLTMMIDCCCYYSVQLHGVDTVQVPY